LYRTPLVPIFSMTSLPQLTPYATLPANPGGGETDDVENGDVEKAASRARVR
jgi:hypothetical protein